LERLNSKLATLASQVTNYAGTASRMGRVLAGGNTLPSRCNSSTSSATNAQKLAIGFFFGRSVADAAPGEKVRAIAHVEPIGFLPSNKLEILVLWFHLLTSWMA
jgi:hypothetical protein